MTTRPLELPAVSLRALAQILDVDRDVVRSAITRAALSPVATRGGHPVYDMRQALRAVLSKRGEADPANLTPGDRKNIALAKRAEFDLAVRRKQYLPVDAVARAAAEGFQTCAQRIRSLPDNLERKLGLSPEQCDHAERVVDSVLDALADDLEKIHNSTLPD